MTRIVALISVVAVCFGLVCLTWTILEHGVPRALLAAGGGTLTCGVKPSCGTGEVPVFRMSSTGNAHAGTAGGSAYGSVVCCGGVAGLGADCSGAHDTVLTLSGADNAHAASDASYATAVCLTVGAEGAVDCEYGATCDAGYACLATISGATNAHVADCDGSGDYATKVCCRAVGDNCPLAPNPGQENTDITSDPPGDTFGDACDNCPLIANEGQINTDAALQAAGASVAGDSQGDPCDADDDNDGWPDTGAPVGGKAAESYLRTVGLDNCPNSPPGPGGDAWPLDINADTFVTTVGDVLFYQGRIGATGGPPSSPNWWQRLDLNGDNFITLVGDVLKYNGRIGESCT
jgi:hypothetical protein